MVWFSACLPHLTSAITPLNAMLKQLRLLVRSEPAICATRSPELEADFLEMGLGTVWLETFSLVYKVNQPSYSQFHFLGLISGPSDRWIPTLFFGRPSLTPTHLTKATEMGFPVVHR